jgi:hypothetical protein
VRDPVALVAEVVATVTEARRRGDSEREYERRHGTCSREHRARATGEESSHGGLPYLRGLVPRR